MKRRSDDLADLSDLRVVFVEDEDDLREASSAVLRASGADVAEARSIAEAISLVGSWRPDVLVSDLGLRGEDGVELIRLVRALPRGGGGAVPAIALTGRTALAEACAALRAGFQVHVAKPIDSWMLTHAVANVAGLAIAEIDTP